MQREYIYLYCMITLSRSLKHDFYIMKLDEIKYTDWMKHCLLPCTLCSINYLSSCALAFIWMSFISLLINPVSADHQVHDNPILASPWLFLIIWLPDLLDICRIHVFFPCFLRIGSVIHCLKNLSRDSRFRSLVTRSSAASSFASSLQTNSEKVIISYYSNPCVNKQWVKMELTCFRR